MIIRHSRHPGSPEGPGAAALIDLGGRARVLLLAGPDGAPALRFLGPDGAPLAADAAGFLAAPWAGPGPLDWEAAALVTDGGGAEGVRAMIADLHVLVEALAAAAAASEAHRVRVLTGEADARAGAMLAVLDRLNRAPPGAPAHLPEIVTEAIVARGGQETAHPDGGSLRLAFHLPMTGFRFAGFSPDPAEPLCTLAARNSRLALGLLDARANRVYARPGLAGAGFDALALARVRLWRLYLHPAMRAGAARAERVGIVFEHAHMGHYLWNELGAVDAVLALGRAPSVFLFASCDEPVFPVDAVFPEVAGHVQRGLDGPLPFLQAAAAGEAVFLPFRAYRVSRRLADRLAVLARDAEPALDARLAEAARGATLVLIGLRLENRAWIRQAEGYAALVRRLGRRPGERFLVVIDGHNTGPVAGGFIRSHCEGPDPAGEPVPPVVRLEIDLVASLRARCSDVRTVEIVSLVPCTMAASLVAALRADLFATHWGAGLAKYKWVANGRGCVVSSRAVLAGKDDLRIYDSEVFREDALPCAWYPADRVRDLDGSGNAVPVPGGREREDFDLDPEDFARFVAAHLPGPKRGRLVRGLARLLPARFGRRPAPPPARP